MNGNKLILPELCYGLAEDMSLEKISRAITTGDFLIAKVSRFNSQEELFEVDLGNGFHGKIPLDDFSIYPCRRLSAHISPAAYSLIGKNICACVQEISDYNMVILSRKANMIKSFNYIKHLESKIVSCSILAITQYGLFVDVGHGINGLIRINDLTISRIHDISDLGFATGQLIDAKIISINSEKYQISLNHKDLFDNLAYTLNPGDFIEAISLDPLDDEESGYFAHINHNTKALMDPPEGLKIPYGSRVVARVKRFSPNKPDKVRLKFISLID